MLVFLSDGGNTEADPAPALARLAGSGVRTFSIGLGGDIDFSIMRQIATTPNELYFAFPHGRRLGLCRLEPGPVSQPPAAGARRR